MDKIKTCICTICKNEIRYIRRFLKKHIDSDYIVILDTGSTDGTWEFLQEYSQRHPQLIIQQKIYDKFRFDVARNDSLKYIPEDSDIYVSIDIDEFLSKNWKNFLIENYDPLIDVYNIFYKEKRFKIERALFCSKIFKYNKNGFWKYPVHENYFPGSQNLTSKRLDSSIFITHTPYEGDRKNKKVSFYNQLLDIRLEENPNEKETLFYELYRQFQEKNANKEIVSKIIYDINNSKEFVLSTADINLIYCAYISLINSTTHREHEDLKYLHSLINIENPSKKVLKKISKISKSLCHLKGFEYIDKASSISKKLDFHALREDFCNLKDSLQKVSNTITLKDEFDFITSEFLNMSIALSKNLEACMRSLETITPLNRLAIEVLLADHCNLNCAYCNHFSPIAKKKFYEYKTFKKDIVQLRKIFKNDIWDIKLMGGEPLLNKDITKFMSFSRLIFPKAQISILTNGLKLPSMNTAFWRSLKLNKVRLYITKYKDTPIEQIEAVCRKFNVKFEYYPDPNNETPDKNYMEKFCVNLDGNTNVLKRFLDCGNANKTITLKDGHLYTCPFKATVSHFNEFFKENVPFSYEKDSINIYEITNKEDAYKFFSRPTPLCSYCFGECEKVEWDYSKLQKDEWQKGADFVPKFERNFTAKVIDDLYK